MADIIEINISVVDKGNNLEKAITKTKTLEGRVKSLAKEIDKGTISDKKRSQTLTALARELKKVTDYSGQKAAGQIRKYLNQQLKAIQADKEAADYKQRLAKVEKYLADRRKRSIQVAKQQAAATKQQALEEERLRHKFVEGHTAADIYSKELNDLAMAHKAGIINAQQQAAAVAKLNQDMAKGSGKFSPAMLNMQKSTNGANVAIQQLGYQVSDFAVQVQSGTNPFIAFSQQGAQLVGVLPLVADKIGMTTARAIALSAGLGIAIPLFGALGAALWRFGKDADSGADAAKIAKDRIKELNQSLREYMDTKEAMESGLTLDQLLLRSSTNLSSKPIEDRIKSIKESIKGINDSVTSQTLDAQMEMFLAAQDPNRPQKATGYSTIGPDIRKSQYEGMNVGEQPEAVKGLQEEIALQEKRVALRKAYNELTLVNMPRKRLEAKLAEEAVLAERESSRAIEEKIALLEAEFRYGEDSLKVSELQKEFDVQAFAREVASLDITEKRKIALIEMFKVQADGQEKAIKDQETLNTLQGQSEMFVDALAETTDKARDKAAEYVERVQKLEEEIGEAAVTALALADVDLSKGVDKAAKAAAVLATKLGVSYGFAAKLVAIAGKSAEENLFDTKVRSGILPPQAASDFGVKGGKTPYALKTYMDQIDAKVKAELEASKGGGGTADSLKSGTEYINRVLIPEMELRRKAIGLSAEQVKRQEFEFDLRQKLDKYKDKASEKEIELVMKRYDEIVRLEEQMKIIDYAQGQMEDFFMAIIDGTTSIEDAFKGMLRNILLEIYKQQIAQPVAQGIGDFLKGAITGGFGGGGGVPRPVARPTVNANGNAFYGGSIIPFANGGVVGSPMFFPMSGGQTGLMGEAGPEAIMPLKRGADGKLGVAGGGGVVVHQTFNFAANGDDSVKKIIAQAAPQIAEMTKRSVIADRRRGGQMKAAFN